MTDKTSLAAGTFAGARARIQDNASRGLWSSRWVFFLAATGSAVGLGNIWKFPYVTGQNGGGAFVLVYLACILLIGIPLLMAEVMIGRRGRANPDGAVARLAREAGASSRWRVVGWLGGLTGFLILSFYLVVAGWALAYVPATFSGGFTGVSGEASGALFGALLADPLRLVVCATLVLAATMLIVGFGVRGGLERSLRFLMPGLFVLMLVLVVYAAIEGEFAQALQFLFVPDFSELTAQSVLVALGHAFFTLSLGCGAMMVYGSYLPEGTSIAKTSILVALADTAVALLAGLAIFPLVFGNALEPGAGPGLIFVTLPIAFGQMPLGQVVGGLFFVMLVIAALTSAISLSEPSIAWLTERFRISRTKAVLGSAAEPGQRVLVQPLGGLPAVRQDLLRHPGLPHHQLADAAGRAGHGAVHRLGAAASRGQRGHRHSQRRAVPGLVEAAALRHAGGHRAGVPQPTRADLARPRSSVQNAPVG